MLSKRHYLADLFTVPRDVAVLISSSLRVYLCGTVYASWLDIWNGYDDVLNR